MAEQHHIAAQKAIDGLRLSFKNNKKPAKSAVERLHPEHQTKGICGCCGQSVGEMTAIDSGQKLCKSCLKELRG